jgi:hypothetical protein
MKTRRKLSRKERRTLIRRLQELDPSVAETCGYPLRSLTAFVEAGGKLFAWLRPARRLVGDDEVEEEDGKIVTYFLWYSTPPITWSMLCGRAGIYTIDADSLKKLSFKVMVLN